MVRGSEAFMRPQVLGAPELVAPWPAKVGFFVSCNSAVERQHEVLWTEIKSSSANSRQRWKNVK